MRYSITILFFFIIAGIFSCKKDSSPSSSASITGTWNVVSDSTYNSGVGSGNNSTSNVYTGKSGDYFQFTTGGGFSANEGNILSAKGTYAVSGNIINIQYSKLVSDGTTLETASGNYTISSLSDARLVLTNRVLTQGARFMRLLR